MFTPQPLDILFLTNFSDYCFRSIPAIADMAGTFKVRLTLMHVYDPARSSQNKADEQINSFFPEADRYGACHRIAAPGRLSEVVLRHLKVWPVNLIVAPASDEIGVPRIGRRCKRSRLIQESGVPVWTIGRRVQLQRLTHPVRNVACWLDFYSLCSTHLSFAIEYATKLNAKLHLLRALPEIHEGALGLGAPPERALHPDLAAEEIMRLCANASIRPEVHISCGSDRRSTVARMLRECDANVAFFPCEGPSLGEWLGLGLRMGDGIPCPAIYVGDRLGTPVWNLETSAVDRARNVVGAATGLRGEPAIAVARNGNRSASVSRSSQFGPL